MATTAPISVGELVGAGAGGDADVRHPLSHRDEVALHHPHNHGDGMSLAGIDEGTINQQPLEVYMHYARLEREREAADTRPIPDAPWIAVYKRIRGIRPVYADDALNEDLNDTAASGYVQHDDEKVSSSNSGPDGEGLHRRRQHQAAVDHEKTLSRDEKVGEAYATTTTQHDPSGVSEADRTRAYLALRSASWQGVFYLITTDILGFSSAPYAFMELGYGPGCLVYFFFYILAFLGGQILWRMYVDLDSRQYPVRNYSDLGERVFGRKIRHLFNILQSLQLILNVGIITLGNSQTLGTIINYHFCFSIINVLFTILGACVGQVRSLRAFGWFANTNVWLNVLVMILTMVGCAVFDPVPSQNGYTSLAPIKRHTWVPPGEDWFVQVQGVQLAVFAYGGAMIFVEFMAEMRRPHDFWKAAFIAQTFIFIVYMFFGLFVYSYQGQFAAIIPALGFANKALSLTTNIISLITSVVAAVLYGNIGVKVLYYNVLQAYFNAPTLVSEGGRVWWSICVVIYWILAFVIASAIPNMSSMLTLVGAACILQFTYTFPPVMYLGYLMQRDALEGDQPWQPGMTGFGHRRDTWRQMSRWKRGFRRHWYLKSFLFLIFLSALALCGLGIYAGVEQLKTAFKASSTVSFSCRTPGQPADVPTPLIAN